MAPSPHAGVVNLQLQLSAYCRDSVQNCSKEIVQKLDHPCQAAARMRQGTYIGTKQPGHDNTWTTAPNKPLNHCDSLSRADSWRGVQRGVLRVAELGQQ